jgi:hypothetical protein
LLAALESRDGLLGYASSLGELCLRDVTLPANAAKGRGHEVFTSHVESYTPLKGLCLALFTALGAFFTS